MSQKWECDICGAVVQLEGIFEMEFWTLNDRNECNDSIESVQLCKSCKNKILKFSKTLKKKK